MEYAFANTYKQDADAYVEDRGFLRTVSRGDADFEIVDAHFGSMLQTGQTAVHNDYLEWEMVDGDAITSVYAEPLARSLRAKRDALLAQTDYLLMPDYPIEPERKEAVEAYRQALRDLPSQKSWPLSVNWPEAPDA